MTITRRDLLAVAAGASAMLSTTGPAGAVRGATAAPVRDPLGGEWDAEGVVERGGGRLHYFERGSGEPLVMLSKLGGWAADWRQIAPALAARHRVIAIDPPGHGGSTMFGPAPYVQTVAESAAMVRAALEELAVERYSLVGNSLGGCIGVLLSSLWPDRVRKLVLVSVSLAQGESRAVLRGQDVEARGVNYDASDLPLTRSVAQVARFGTRDPAVVEEHNRSRAIAGRWVRASERGVALAGIASYLPGIQADTLLLYGEHGNYREFQSVGEAHLHSVRTGIIAGSGAFTHQEQPAATAAAIGTFLDAGAA